MEDSQAVILPEEDLVAGNPEADRAEDSREAVRGEVSLEVDPVADNQEEEDNQVADLVVVNRVVVSLEVDLVGEGPLEANREGGQVVESREEVKSAESPAHTSPVLRESVGIAATRIIMSVYKIVLCQAYA